MARQLVLNGPELTLLVTLRDTLAVLNRLLAEDTAGLAAEIARLTAVLDRLEGVPQ